MCSPVDRKRQSVDQFLVGNDLVLTGRDTGRYSPLLACGPSFASHACWLISPFFATGVGLVGRSQKRSSSAMCDYSLHHVKSRPAKVGDKLTTRNFNTGTRGFVSPDDRTTAVCILPGTELAFSADVKWAPFSLLSWRVKVIESTTAIFRQVNEDIPRVHHDALEFADGTCVLLTDLLDGQEATVLQLPAQPKTPAEEATQRRITYVG